MKPDLTQTLPHDLNPQQDETDIGMRTTLIQPISASRHSDLARTRYWESESPDDTQPKPAAASYACGGSTRIGLGPDDPLVQAVEAAKRQLMASRATQSTHTEKTVRMQVATVTHLDLESHKPAPLPQPPAKPKRKPKALAFVALGVLGALVCVVSVSSLTPTGSSSKREEPMLVKPRPTAPATDRVPAAPPKPATPTSVAAQAPALLSPTLSPTPSPTTEKAAVDALFAGDYELAARHYAALAQAHPERPAFFEAARILRRRAAAEAQ